jgi:predicted AAA+ superfamily ATPase
MAQREILNFLKSNPNKMFSAKSLSNEMNIGTRVITKDVKMLNKYHLIDLEINKKRQNRFTFGFNINK